MIYYSKGKPILEYDDRTGDMTTPLDEDTGAPHFNACSFTNSDLCNIASFFTLSLMHRLDNTTELENVEVG